MKADLHVHTTASDGSLTPTEVVRLAAQRGVHVLAIADHDSVAGLAEATSAAQTLDVTLIPAVELSTITDDGQDAHMLGYYVDANDRALLSHLADLREARLRRARAIVGALQGAGYEVDLDTVLRFSDGGSVGRSHIARALVSAGHAESVREAFQRFIGHGMPFYVAKDVRTPRQACEIIRAAGGLPVIAHPGVNHADAIVEDLAGNGLAGVEAFHADHTPEQREHYAAMAARLGLLVTGGTDFHGPDAPNPQLGDIDIPAAAVEALLGADPRR